MACPRPALGAFLRTSISKVRDVSCFSYHAPRQVVLAEIGGAKRRQSQPKQPGEERSDEQSAHEDRRTRGLFNHPAATGDDPRQCLLARL